MVIEEGMVVSATAGDRTYWGRVQGVKWRMGRITSIDIRWQGDGGCTALNTEDATCIRIKDFKYGWSKASVKPLID